MFSDIRFHSVCLFYTPYNYFASNLLEFLFCFCFVFALFILFLIPFLVCCSNFHPIL